MAEHERPGDDLDLRRQLEAAIRRAEQAERERDDALKRGRLNRRVAVQSLVHSTALRRALGRAEEAGDPAPGPAAQGPVAEPGPVADPLPAPADSSDDPADLPPPGDEAWRALVRAARGLEPWKEKARQLHGYGVSSMAIQVGPLVALFDALDRLRGAGEE